MFIIPKFCLIMIIFQNKLGIKMIKNQKIENNMIQKQKRSDNK